MEKTGWIGAPRGYLGTYELTVATTTYWDVNGIKFPF